MCMCVCVRVYGNYNYYIPDMKCVCSFNRSMRSHRLEFLNEDRHKSFLYVSVLLSVCVCVCSLVRSKYTFV